MKRILVLMLALLLVPAFSTPVLAVDLPTQNPLKMTLSEPSQEEIDDARLNDFKTIKVLTDTGEDAGDFMGIEWINQSNYANKDVTTKYKTFVFEFQIGPYKGHIDAEQFRTPGAPGQEVIKKVTITRETLINAYSQQGDREAVEEALDTEAYLYVRAWIIIYDDKNGDGLIQYPDEFIDVITKKEEIDTKAAMFPEKNKQDMRSRFQEVPINGGKKPDFFPTPEGETEWRAEFLECAKTYDGNPGEEITFPVTLTNQGEKSTTNFMAVWEGQGDDPEKGWAGSNPPWKTDTIELNKNSKQTFNVTIPFPSPGQPNKLYFMANVDGNTPANETNKDNNIMAIVFKKPGVDLAIAGKPQSAIVKLPQTSTQMAGVVLYTITRKDGGADPVQATLTMNGPSGTKTESITVTSKPLTRSYVYKTNKPGTYSFSAEIWPITETEVYPTDNRTQTSIQFMRDSVSADPGKQDGDKNLEVGLTG